MAEAFGLAANVVAVVDLFLKLGVLCSEYCVGVKHAPREIKDLLREVDRWGLTLREVETILEGPNGSTVKTCQSIQEGVEDCRTELNLLTAKLKEGTGHRRITWPFKRAEVAEVVGRLGRHRTSIATGLLVCQTTLIIDIHQQIIDSKLRVVPRAAYDCHSDADNARCYPGTRVEILADIRTWADDVADDSKRIFWLNGMAGTGKSTISRTAAEHFARSGKLGASFFFKRGEGDRGHARLFFPTIAAQLARQLPPLAQYVREAIDADPTICEKPIKEHFDSLLQGPINHFPSSSSPAIKIIVVDALDECDNLNNIQLILYLLRTLAQPQSIRLKFFLTSRPELPIRIGFQNINGHHDLVLHEVPRPVIEHDLDLFFRHELAKILDDYNKSVLPRRSLPLDWPGEENVRKLVDRSIPLFILAATISRFIQDRRHGGPQQQILKVLEQQETYLSGLAATYSPVLDQLTLGLGRLEAERVVDMFKDIVGSIVVLASPLSAESLCSLLNFPLDTIEAQLDLLHSVLNIPPDSAAPVRLLHLSFRDFLISPDEDGHPFWVGERRAHHHVAIRCISLLDGALKKDICGLRLPGGSRADLSQETIDMHLSPEIQYACRNWIYHWKKSQHLLQDDDIVHRFLTRHLLHWLEALSVLGYVPDGVGMVQDLINSLNTESSTKIYAFLYDIQRFIRSNRGVLHDYPLQIYSSALIFAPERSIVRKTFRDQFPEWVSQLPRVTPYWDLCFEPLSLLGDFHTCHAFSPESTMVASGTIMSKVRLWDVATGLCLNSFTGHTSFILTLCFSHDSKLLASSDYRSVRLWDVAMGVCKKEFKGRADNLRFSHNSQLLASALGTTVTIFHVERETRDRTIECRNVKTCPDFPHLPGRRAQLLEFLDNSRVLAVSVCHEMEFWDVRTGNCINSLHMGFHPLAMFFADDSKVLVASTDSLVYIWDITSGTCVRKLDLNPAGIVVGNSYCVPKNATASLITPLTWFSSSDYVAFSQSLKKHVLDASGHLATPWMELSNHGARLSKDVKYATFSHDSKTLAVRHDDGRLELWGVAELGLEEAETGIAESLGDVAFLRLSLDSKLVAVSGRSKLRVENTLTNTIVLEYPRQCGPAAFSSDSGLLAVCFLDDEEKHRIGIWDVMSGGCVHIFDDLFEDLVELEFSYDKRFLAGYYWTPGKYTFLLLDLTTWTSMPIFESKDDGPPLYTSFVFSRDSELLAFAQAPKFVRIRQMTARTCYTIKSLENDALEDLRSLAGFLSNSNFLVSLSERSGNSEYELHLDIWNLASRTRVVRVPLGFALPISPRHLEESGAYLQMPIGTFVFNPPLSQFVSTLGESNPAGHPSGLSVERRGIALTEHCSWITWNSHRLLRLHTNPPPPVFSGVGITDSTLILLSIHGSLISIGFDLSCDLFL